MSEPVEYPRQWIWGSLLGTVLEVPPVKSLYACLDLPLGTYQVANCCSDSPLEKWHLFAN